MQIEKLLKHPAYKQISLKYPHIANNMKAYWGTNDFAPYTHKLFTDTRNGERRGFPQQDLAALREIEALHNAIHKNVWTSIYTRW